MKFTAVAMVVLAGAGAAALQPAKDPSGHTATYVKRELFIPMRDGVKLFTIVYAPRDTTRRYPFLMTRTAYGIAVGGGARRCARMCQRYGQRRWAQGARAQRKPASSAPSSPACETRAAARSGSGA